MYEEITYKECGIDDVNEFYKDKFANETDFEIEKNINYQYDIGNLRQIYIFDYIKPNSKVLDFGCGSGIFKILKKINCNITGIDFSEKAIKIAKNINCYDEAYNIDIFDKFYDKFKNKFDYIISSDVFGHIEFKDKNKIIKRLKYLLKKDGVFIHGIETGDIKYNSMTFDERKKFSIVDGHVGIETESKIKNRFDTFFNNVTIYNPYWLICDLNELIKQYEDYNTSNIDSELLEFLKSNIDNPYFLKVFNLSQFCAHKALELNQKTIDKSGFSFVICSDVKIEKNSLKKPRSEIQYGYTFYNEEYMENKIFRWSPTYSYIILNNISEIILKFDSYIPNFTKKDQNIYIHADGEILSTINFNSDNNSTSYKFKNIKNLSSIKIEFYSDSCFTPLLFDKNNHDKRTLSFMLSISSQKAL